MWAREMTVAETYQGSPSTDVSSINTATQNRSRWKPPPFCRERVKAEDAAIPGLGPLSSSPLGWTRDSLDPTLEFPSLGLRPYLQSIFCTVEDDCCYLLVHEDENR
jgi:hypothetical protein